MSVIQRNGAASQNNISPACNNWHDPLLVVNECTPLRLLEASNTNSANERNERTAKMANKDYQTTIGMWVQYLVAPPGMYLTLQKKYEDDRLTQKHQALPRTVRSYIPRTPSAIRIIVSE